MVARPLGDPPRTEEARIFVGKSRRSSVSSAHPDVNVNIAHSFGFCCDSTNREIVHSPRSLIG